MRRPIYNLGIPERISRADGFEAALCARALRLAFIPLLLLSSLSAAAADWSAPEQELARKIVGIIGPGTVALAIVNRSSLSRRDNDIVQNGLRSALEQAGVRFAGPEQAASSVTISLSENLSFYVWVAEIRQNSVDSNVVIVSVPHSGRVASTRDSMPIALSKTLLWTQRDLILDIAVLDEGTTPTRIAVLSRDNVSFYRWAGGKWQAEQVMSVAHAKPWPLDLRGRLVLTKDRLLDVYLPGVICHSNAGGTLAMNCHEGDDPWPISEAWISTPSSFTGAQTIPVMMPNLAGFFASTRNFFTGVITPPIGKFATVPKFYSAAFVPRERYALWLFAATDGKVHLLDGMSDQTIPMDWGSDIATLRTSCGAGWQVLATGTSQREDFVRAYEFPDRDPVAVSAVEDFPGEVSALWSENRGDSAIAVVDNHETGNYEAYRVGVACNQ